MDGWMDGWMGKRVRETVALLSENGEVALGTGLAWSRGMALWSGWWCDARVSSSRALPLQDCEIICLDAGG